MLKPKPKISEEQKKIALLLMYEPKTIEDLFKQLSLPYNTLSEELRKMMQAGLVEKKGFPTKYSLKQVIKDEINRRKEIQEKDENKIRLLITIEAQAIEPNLLEKNMKKIEEALKKEKNLTIYDSSIAEIQKEGEHYSTFLEANLSVKNFQTLIALMFFYAPTSIEVIKPKKIELNALDLQDGLIDLSDMITKYANYISKSMGKTELNEFNKKLFGD